MKKFATLACTLLLAASLHAQKVYSTKTGFISFFSSAPLEDIEAKNTRVESKLNSGSGEVFFTMLIKDFHFENDLMEDHFNENYLESDKFPKGELKGFITNIKDVDFSKDGIYPVRVKGTLAIHGVTKDVEIPGSLEIRGGVATARSKFNVVIKQFGIGGSLIGKKIAETVQVTVNLRYD